MKSEEPAPVEITKNPGQEDEDIQRRRLLIQHAKFKALATWSAKFSREIETGSAEQCEAPLKNLVKEILNMEYWSRKMDATKAATRRDKDSYTCIKAEQEAAIVQAQQDIELRKTELEGARVLRQQNEEYETLRDEVMQHPARAATTAECEQLELDILRLQAESERLDAVADLRRKQFALLLRCVDDLAEELGEGDETAQGVEPVAEEGPVRMDEDES